MFAPVTTAELATSEIFSSLSQEDLEEIAERSIKVYVRKGIQLLKKGESGFEFFVLLDGTAEVMVDGEVIATLGPGSVFGEAALMGGGKRNADVVATSHLTLATMMVWDFREMTESHPEISERLTSLVRQRSGSRG
jgi:CPA2 family monovalent cation:H+ antiporter-2